MKLILPHSATPQLTNGGYRFEPAAGISIFVDTMRELPADLRRWGDAVVLQGVPADRLQVREVTDAATHGEWPLTLVRSDVLKPPNWEHSIAVSPQPEVRRLHALYRFLHYGVVAVAWGDPARMDAQDEELIELFKQGRPDFSTDEISSLAQLFADLPT